MRGGLPEEHWLHQPGSLVSIRRSRVRFHVLILLSHNYRIISIMANIYSPLARLYVCLKVRYSFDESIPGADTFTVGEALLRATERVDPDSGDRAKPQLPRPAMEPGDRRLNNPTPAKTGIPRQYLLASARDLETDPDWQKLAETHSRHGPRRTHCLRQLPSKCRRCPLQHTEKVHNQTSGALLPERLLSPLEIRPEFLRR